ncbi:MFS transporter [Citrobacter rodentium]|uniref:Major Facilitator Superfamily transporter n=2 Tax=Citrobacter rodentium TaxID=67825 RepID=D2TKJ6_CITRI|nr:MFS transporter [Citrobacter rodentium]KIQ52697.1 quinolone resistance protein [Citrobacter rodentium]QBY29469.1 MFS transporter [Citrobacter rodentium]UHO33135.1 MFS transporter [Citrobacter rodentium NBRC 105723 = DSM 16636]CBG89768.1 Major Facilitator Superfamily transporter [Citrobacter rodentium ICC168]HAT8012509.1 MFS transporter [Citrobacter rodentium NBRC 105723 = DSM 16636]
MSTVPLTGTRTYAGNDRLLAGIVLSVLTFWLFAQSVINVVPAMKSSLDISLETLTLAVSLSALFSGCFVVASGGLADKFGRVRLTLIGLLLSVTGSALLMLAQGPALFLAGRAIQGLSAACIMPATLALIKTWYEGKARQRAISFWVIGSWGGSGLSSFVGGAIATSLGWRWIFAFSILVALVAFILIRNTPESRSAEAQQHKLDVTGLVSFVTMLVMLNLFISKGHGWGWNSGLSLSVLGLAALAAIGFIATGLRKGDAALIDFALFKNRAYSAAVLSNFMLNGCIGTMMIASIWLQQGHHLSPLQTGMMTLGYLVTVLSMIRVGEKLLQRYGARLPMLTGPVLTAIGITFISCTFLSKEVYIVTVFFSNVLFGLGLGCYATPSTDTAVMNSPESKVGVASGIYKMGSSLGGAMGIAVTASLYALLLPLGMASAAQYALLFNSAICLSSALVSWALLPGNR